MAPKAHNHRRRHRAVRRSAAALLVAVIAEALAKIVLGLLESLFHIPPRALP